MTNREKIIVGLAVLALGYGAVELLLPRAKVAPVAQPQSLEGLNAFIAKVADATRSGAAEAGTIAIQKAEAAWKQDPFLEIRKPQAPRPETTGPKDGGRLPGNFVYSGFIEIGARRMAIINGMEYEAGDTAGAGRPSLRISVSARCKSAIPQAAEWV